MRATRVLPFLTVFVAAPAWAQTGDAAGGSTTQSPPADGSPSVGSAGSATTGSGSAGAAGQAQPQVVVVREQAPRSEPREEDDGRGADILWIEGVFGYSYVDLVMFSQDNFLPSVDRLAGSGWTTAVAAGMRVSFLMFGGRATLSSYEGFDLWTVGGEVHLRLPLAALEPYARVGFGYGWVGQADYDHPEASESDVYGLVVDAGAGLDIYLDKIFAIGVGMDGAFLNLSRQRLDEEQCAPDCVDDINFTEDGDSAGLQLRLHAHASLHF